MPNLQHIRLVPDEGLGSFFLNICSLLALKLLLLKELCYNIHAQDPSKLRKNHLKKPTFLIFFC